MINASKKFKKEILQNRNFYVTADCTLPDGTILKLKKEDFYNSGNGIVDASDSSDFPLGAAVEKTATLSLVNDDDRFSDYNFNAARFVIYLNLLMADGTTEILRRGTFVVSKKPSKAQKINLTLLDKMHNADRAYTTNLIFPATAGEILRDSCQTCGILVGDASFPNDDFVVQEKPANTTHRAVIGACAMLAGGNARIDESDRLRIITFARDAFESMQYDGGSFAPWTAGDTLDGGSMNPWTEGQVIDGGNFTDTEGYHVFSRILDLQVDTDDLVVTGVKTKVDETEYQYGSDGYVVVVENLLIAGKESEAVQRIGEQIIGLKMRPFSCRSIAYPLATFMDPAYVTDIKGRYYVTYLINIEFLFNGYTTISNNTKSAIENASDFSTINSVEVEQSKKEMEKKLSAYDIAVQNMNQLAANTLGFFYTQVKNADGSIVSYRHDKPLLADSKIVYKTGSDGFFVTNDYQGTDEATTTAGKWKSGFDSNGDAVLNILYAIGIHSEWINTRGLTAKDNEGNITFRVDAGTGKIDIVANSFSLLGKSIDEIAEQQVNDFVNAVYDPKIQDLQNQIDGQIESYYKDHEPTLQNEPASAWTTEEECQKHEGDLFYWKSKGFAYRFLKDGNTWKWQIIQDTDITKALAQAAKAQDTADGKRRVFLATPTTPYDAGDMWTTSTTDGKAEIKICKTSRASGAFVSGDWISPSYVDSDDIKNAIDSYDTSLGQTEVFNKLTNGGKTKGIYIQDGELYINASYILSGVLAGKLINGKGLNVIDKDNQITLKIDDDGHVYIKATEFSLEGKSIDELVEEKSDKFVTLNVILSNEYQGIPTDMNGAYTSFPSCSTTVKVLYGSEDVTTTSTIQWAPSSGVSGSASGATYTVTGLSTDTGTVKVTVSRGNLSVEKIFTIAKQKQGVQGLQGLQGKDGANGINGVDGKDGKTTYFHIKYSSVANPTSSAQLTETPNTYIGTYVDYTEADSTDPKKYTWARFQGLQGENGIPGKNGADGKTSYLHIKYSNDGGKTFTSNNGETPGDYIGQYTDFTQADSTNVSAYTWSKIRGEQGLRGLQGEKGEQGIPGTKGADGKTSYTHIAYANSADGKTDFSVSNSDRQYIGMYVDFNSTDSTDPTKYAWSKIKGADGAQGIPGTAGKDGKTPYLHIAYATSSDGNTGFSVTDSNGKTYIGQYTDFISADSTDPSRYSWSKIKGEQGATGNGISSVVTYYLATSMSSGVSTSTSGWTTSVQTPTTVKPYLWSYQTTIYTNGSTSSTSPHIIGIRGSDGEDAGNLTQQEIFDILTNNGTNQGIYLYNGQIYINATKIDTGDLCGWTIDRVNKRIYCEVGYNKVFLDAKNGRVRTEGDTQAFGGYGYAALQGNDVFCDTLHALTLSTPDGKSMTLNELFSAIENGDGDGGGGTATIPQDLEINTLTVKKKTVNGSIKFYVLKSPGSFFETHPIGTVDLSDSTMSIQNDIHYIYSTLTGIAIYGSFGAYGGYSLRSIATASSDIRLKKNISKATIKALPVIKKIGMYQFDWRQDGSHQNIGFIADYLEELDERMAIGGGYDSGGGMIEKSVNDFYLLGYVVKAMQEMNDIVEAQKKQIDEQAKKIEGLESRLARLEQMIGGGAIGD